MQSIGEYSYTVLNSIKKLFQVPERIEQCPQLSKNDNLEQNEEVLKPPDMAVKNNADIRHTEVNALKMEVETLRWQLSQVNIKLINNFSLIFLIYWCTNIIACQN